MVQLSMFSFLALLEVLLAMALLLGFMVWRQRKLRSIRHTDSAGMSDDEPLLPTPSLYLDSEAAKTKTFVEFLSEQLDASPREPALRTALSLRAGLLRQESELAKHPVVVRDAGLWTTLAEQIARVIDAEGYAHANASVEGKVCLVFGEDTAPSDIITAQQKRTIAHLRDYIQQLLEKVGHQPMPDLNISARFDELERANREYSQCVAVLEDENSFLRDQIAALLKAE